MIAVLVALGVVGVLGIASAAFRHEPRGKRRREGDAADTGWSGSGDPGSDGGCHGGDGGCDGGGGGD